MKKLSTTFVLVVAAAAVIAADGIRVAPLVRGDQVLVSMELADGYSDDVRAAIHSGLRTTLTYTIDLRLDVPIWIDRTIASAVVSTSVQYDNLTRRHTIVRAIDGRVDEARTTEDESVVREVMTTFKRLALFRTSDLEVNREYYVRVRGAAQPRNVSFIFPWDNGPSGSAKFTFVR